MIQDQASDTPKEGPPSNAPFRSMLKHLELWEQFSTLTGAYTWGTLRRFVGVVMSGPRGNVTDDEMPPKRRWWSILRALWSVLSTLAEIVDRLRTIAADETLDGDSHYILTEDAVADLERELDDVRAAFPGWLETYFDLAAFDEAMQRALREPEQFERVQSGLEWGVACLDVLIEDSLARVFDHEHDDTTLDPDQIEDVLRVLDRVLEEWLERWVYPRILDIDRRHADEREGE